MSRHQSAKKDEAYVIDLCDEILGLVASRQHRFDFLRDDPGKTGIGVQLPMDAYYEEIRLVVEYRERQHSEPVGFFDRRETVSGVSRGDQRAKYDQRRRDVLPQYGIELVELGYDDFQCDAKKRLIRNRSKDKQVVRLKLAKWIFQGECSETG